jgi:hypothetical protein
MATCSYVDVVAIDAPTFYRVAAAFPRLLHNVGAMLSQRLTRSYRQAVVAQHGTVTVLVDHGAPARLGYALASSFAWHTRGPVVLVMVTRQPPVVLELATGFMPAVPLIAERRIELPPRWTRSRHDSLAFVAWM